MAEAGGAAGELLEYRVGSRGLPPRSAEGGEYAAAGCSLQCGER